MVSSKVLVMNEALHWVHKQKLCVNQGLGRPDRRRQSVRHCRGTGCGSVAELFDFLTTYSTCLGKPENHADALYPTQIVSASLSRMNPDRSCCSVNTPPIRYYVEISILNGVALVQSLEQSHHSWFAS